MKFGLASCGRACGWVWVGCRVGGLDALRFELFEGSWWRSGSIAAWGSSCFFVLTAQLWCRIGRQRVSMPGRGIADACGIGLVSFRRIMVRFVRVLVMVSSLCILTCCAVDSSQGAGLAHPSQVFNETCVSPGKEGATGGALANFLAGPPHAPLSGSKTDVAQHLLQPPPRRSYLPGPSVQDMDAGRRLRHIAFRWRLCSDIALQRHLRELWSCLTRMTLP